MISQITTVASRRDDLILQQKRAEAQAEPVSELPSAAE
jgi:hypothetical protein